MINLMYDFINRFIEHPNERITESLDRLLPGPNWRKALKEAPTDIPAAREAIITKTFSDALKELGDYRYAPSLRIRRPGHERTLYHLVYGTRSPVGLAVFRESQVKALEEEAVIQSGLKREKRERRTGMGELFPSDMEAGFDSVVEFQRREKSAAVSFLIQLLVQNPHGMKWADLWPQVLDRYAVTRSTLGREVNALRQRGRVEVPGWSSKRKQIPDDEYMILLRPQA